MPNTIVDLDAAMVAGLAKAQEWEAQFQAQWNGPLLMAQAVQMFLSLSPAQQDQLRAADPEAFDELKAQVMRVRGGMHGNPQVPAQGQVDGDPQGHGQGPRAGGSTIPEYQPHAGGPTIPE